MRGFGSSQNMDELINTEAAQYAMLCCECGICEIYACPMELQPCRINILLKEEFRRRGIKPALPEGSSPSVDWPYRRVPSERMAARAELSKYYHLEADRFEDASCKRVAIPLKMHAGAPAVPCVQAGNRVKAGDLIADMGEGQLGARIHASIGGTVREITHCIVIEAGGRDE
jgi:Na+-translocating ferredoxin:NAD+ oxidoreductase RnfC subunit